MTSRRQRRLLVSAVALLGAAALTWWSDALDPLLTRSFQARPAGPTVLLVVLDTVRADHLSACGYERPTSPTLERLRAEGASLSCRAYTPGTWTLPSHASLFTGEPVTVHGADFRAVQDMAEGGFTFATRVSAVPLGPELPTLAERMAEAGYQTASVSGNPLVADVPGLTRGFEVARAAPMFSDWYGGALIDRLERVLRFDLDREGGPLFLFVNIADAHQPWEAIPDGLDWLPPREGFEHDFSAGGGWVRFLTGRMPEREAEAVAAGVTDLYDWGVLRADDTLARVIDTLDRHGWMDAGYRIVVTTDHGEFLGEHRLLDHGVYLWEPSVEGFLLHHSSDPEGAVALMEPMSALAAHDLVLHGAVRDREVVSVGLPNREWAALTDGRVGDVTSVASWEGDEKLLWTDGTVHRYDLARDPEETAPSDGTDHPRAPRLQELGAAAVEAAGQQVEADAMHEMLRSIGYVD